MRIDVSCYDGVLQRGEVSESVGDVLVFCGMLRICGVSGWDIEVGYVYVFVL